jgi:predicted ATPase
MSPEQRRQRTLEVLVSQMEALARQTPVLMIFEDAHWTDPTSLEVLGRIIDRVRSLRVLLIVTFRPDYEPPWVGRPYVMFVALNRMGNVTLPRSSMASLATRRCQPPSAMTSSSARTVFPCSSRR